VRQLLVLAACLSALGCADHTYDTPAAPTPPPNLAVPSTITVNAAPGVGVAGGTASVTATVNNVVGLALANQAVAFSVDVGSLSPTSALTNTHGIAATTLTGQPGTAKVTATLGTLTASTLVSIQPAVGPLPTPTPTPVPTPSPPIVLPLTVSILATAAPTGSPTTFTLSVSPSITSATWSFGDSTASVTTSTAPFGMSHTYTAPGVYTSSVTVTDALNRTASAQLKLTIQNTPPTPYSVTVTCATQNVTVPVPCTATVKDGTTDVTSHFVNFVWNFGDSTTTIATIGPSTSHAFASPATYTITVSVEDAAGRTGSGSQSITVPAPSYTVSLAAAATTVTVNGSTMLTATVTPLNGASASPSLTWDCNGTGSFGAGTNPGTNQNTCTYPTPGTFAAAVKATGGSVTGVGTV
jgi:hypothetical protein